MAANRDAEMQERFEKLTRTVEDFGGRFSAVDQRFDTMDKRFDVMDTRFDAVDERFEAVDRRFDAVDRRLDAVDRRLDAVDRRFDAVDQRFESIDLRFDNMAGQMTALETRILDAFKMEGERIREDVKKAAEGYGATLERIERTLDDTRREWNAKWMVHDRVLKNHGGRITALERVKKP